MQLKKKKDFRGHYYKILETKVCTLEFRLSIPYNKQL